MGVPGRRIGASHGSAGATGLHWRQEGVTMTQHMQQYKAGPLTFIVRHELWDGNIQDHADQGVSIEVAAKVEGKHTVLLRFNCLDIEKSYEYGPDNPKFKPAGPKMLDADAPRARIYRMDPVTDGNPIGWAI